MGLNGVDNGRGWLRRRARAARRPSLNRFARRHRGRRVRLAEIEQPRTPLLHDARHARAGPRLASAAPRITGVGGRADDRDHATRCSAGSSRRRADTEESLLLDYGIAPAPAAAAARDGPTRCTSRRTSSYATTCTTSSPGADDRRAIAGRRSRRAPPAPRPLATWHAHRGRSRSAREACGGAGYLGEPTGSRRSRPTPTSSPPSRATTHVLLQLVAKGPAHRLLRRVRGHGPARSWSASWPVSPSTPSSSGRAVHKLLERVRGTCCPGRRRSGTEPDLLDPDYHLAMLRFREEHMLAGVARAAQARESTGGTQPGRGLLAACRTTSSPPLAPTSSGWSTRPSGAKVRVLPRRVTGTRPDGPPLRPLAPSPSSRPTAPGSWSTAASPPSAPRPSPPRSSALCRQIRARIARLARRRASACPRRCCARRP